ncbi:hypothetical protein J2Z22_000261 [Paenibacillus forsythiae]|uniref:DUF937 domain-containing protein n=1 Tax=Paenibacillus forsythiae TaxID=365616 RepID=A0ABU3H1Q4_9BACL|nr:hypothetical protein [Paenibacillus forsythiae]MDT3424749.1 hypothetical protein [Paenibacillus forsythiae]
MGLNLGGFGDLKGLIEKAKAPGGLMEIAKSLPLDQLLEKLPLDRLLTPEFMQKYTPFQSIGELLQKAGLGSAADSAQRIAEVPRDQLDAQVKENTSFGSMQQLLQKAVEFYQARQSDGK